MIVADTNLVAYLLIEGERTEAVRLVWQRDSDWRLPPLWRSEFLNVLVTTVRAGVITEDQATQAWYASIKLFGRAESEPDGEDVLKAALRHNISAYDAHFAVLAERLGVPLVTGDRRLSAACDDIAVSIEDFVG